MRTKILPLAAIVFLTTFACAPFEGAPSSSSSDALDTAVANTVEAELTAGVPTSTPPEGTPTPSAEATTTPAPSPTPIGAPTSTPALATDTPRPTATPTPTEAPAMTPSATPVLSCAIDIASNLSRLQNHPDILLSLGCPSGEPRTTWAGEQAFQLGRMFWQEDTGKIHILYYDSGAFQVEPDQYEEGDPEFSCPEEGPPPKTLVMPKRGFGWQWCNTPGVREGLGWALEKEIGYHAVWQKFEHGHVLQSHLNEIYVFYEDGTWDYIE